MEESQTEVKESFETATSALEVGVEGGSCGGGVFILLFCYFAILLLVISNLFFSTRESTSKKSKPSNKTPKTFTKTSKNYKKKSLFLHIWMEQGWWIGLWGRWDHKLFEGSLRWGCWVVDCLIVCWIVLSRCVFLLFLLFLLLLSLLLFYLSIQFISIVHFLTPSSLPAQHQPRRMLEHARK